MPLAAGRCARCLAWKVSDGRALHGDGDAVTVNDAVAEKYSHTALTTQTRQLVVITLSRGHRMSLDGPASKSDEPASKYLEASAAKPREPAQSTPGSGSTQGPAGRSVTAPASVSP